MGFGATHGCWAPQLDELLGAKSPGGPPRTRVLLLDNRGVGKSESPLSRKSYTTTIMATDIMCILVSFEDILELFAWNRPASVASGRAYNAHYKESFKERRAETSKTLEAGEFCMSSYLSKSRLRMQRENLQQWTSEMPCLIPIELTYSVL